MAVERGNTKHSQHLDDLMDKEVESLTRGQPVESRAREDMQKEPAAEGEPNPDARVQGGGNRADEETLTPDELEARSELARYLDPSIFPADRTTLLECAARNQAPDAVLAALAGLSGSEAYANVQAIWIALGGRTEQRG